MDWTRSAGSVNKSKIDIVILGLAELTAYVDIYLLRVSKEKFAMCAFVSDTMVLYYVFRY